MSDAAARPVNGLAWKLAEVMAAVDRIPKNGYNEHFKYYFATEQDVKSALREELSKRHIFLKSSIEDVTTNGNVTTIRTLHTFIDGESGEREDFRWSSQGQDNQDKGVSKAATSAVKYALLDNFLIPTGEDPDAAGAATPAAQTHGRQAPAAPRGQQQRPAAATPAPAAVQPAPAAGPPATAASPAPAAGPSGRNVRHDQQPYFGEKSIAIKEYIGEQLKKKGYDNDALKRELNRANFPRNSHIGHVLDNLPDLTGGAQPAATDGYEPSAEHIAFYGSREAAIDHHKREIEAAQKPQQIEGAA